MKNGVLILFSALLGGILSAVVMTIGEDMNRSVELEENMSGAVEEAVAEIGYREETVYTDEMLGDCVSQMAVVFDSDTDIEVRVYQADAVKGILSVRALGNYKHLNGTKGDTSWERTVIYEENGEEERMSNCKVRFYEDKELLTAQGKCYKEFVVSNGASIAEPGIPEKEGRTFAGWRDVNDYIADFSQPILEDISYYAVWE